MLFLKDMKKLMNNVGFSKKKTVTKLKTVKKGDTKMALVQEMFTQSNDSSLKGL